MKIELICIGNELLNGKITDKNVETLARLSYDYGHEINKVHIIPDNEKAFQRSLKEACDSSDIIITSGGLGPTKDDFTKEMMAHFFNKKIVKSKKAHLICEKHYKRMDRIFDPSKNHYDEIPQDFEALYNEVGFAPGLLYKKDKKFILSLPGVPSEFNAMVKSFFERIGQEGSSQKKVHLIYRTWKIAEEKIFYELCPDLWEKLETYGEVSSLPYILGVDIGVTVDASTNLSKLNEVVLNSALKEYIWHIGHERLEEVIIKEAQSKGLTFGFSESCTGGLNASRITDIQGSSSVFSGSIVSYSNDVKIHALGVKEETLNKAGAVSIGTAYEMAEGARKKLKVDIAISTTGIAGPDGGSDEKPVGTIAIGVASKFGTEAKIYHFKGEREALKLRFSQMALYKLLEEVRRF